MLKAKTVFLPCLKAFSHPESSPFRHKENLSMTLPRCRSGYIHSRLFIHRLASAIFVQLPQSSRRSSVGIYISAKVIILIGYRVYRLDNGLDNHLLPRQRLLRRDRQTPPQSPPLPQRDYRIPCRQLHPAVPVPALSTDAAKI